MLGPVLNLDGQSHYYCTVVRSFILTGKKIVNVILEVIHAETLDLVGLPSWCDQPTVVVVVLLISNIHRSNACLFVMKRYITSGFYMSRL